MSDEQTAKNVRSAFQRTYRENQHKEFLEKEKEREKASLPDGARKINGNVYLYHNSFKMRSEADEAAKSMKGSNLTHIERTKKGWSVYLFPT